MASFRKTFSAAVAFEGDNPSDATIILPKPQPGCRWENITVQVTPEVDATVEFASNDGTTETVVGIPLYMSARDTQFMNIEAIGVDSYLTGSMAFLGSDTGDINVLVSAQQRQIELGRV